MRVFCVFVPYPLQMEFTLKDFLKRSTEESKGITIGKKAMITTHQKVHLHLSTVQGTFFWTISCRVGCAKGGRHASNYSCCEWIGMLAKFPVWLTENEFLSYCLCRLEADWRVKHRWEQRLSGSCEVNELSASAHLLRPSGKHTGTWFTGF